MGHVWWLCNFTRGLFKPEHVTCVFIANSKTLFMNFMETSMNQPLQPVTHQIHYLIDSYPPAIKHGVLENGLLISNFPIKTAIDRFFFHCHVWLPEAKPKRMPWNHHFPMVFIWFSYNHWWFTRCLKGATGHRRPGLWSAAGSRTSVPIRGFPTWHWCLDSRQSHGEKRTMGVEHIGI